MALSTRSCVEPLESSSLLYLIDCVQYAHRRNDWSFVINGLRTHPTLDALEVEMCARNLLRGLLVALVDYEEGPSVMPDWVESDYGLRIDDDCGVWYAPEDIPQMEVVVALWLSRLLQLHEPR